MWPENRFCKYLEEEKFGCMLYFHVALTRVVSLAELVTLSGSHLHTFLCALYYVYCVIIGWYVESWVFSKCQH